MTTAGSSCRAETFAANARRRADDPNRFRPRVDREERRRHGRRRDHTNDDAAGGDVIAFFGS
jgi:hypothetical protein